jgi:Mg-chelatase subunit ChlD
MSNTPEYYLCPITQNIMNNPVITDDGYTYEESAIKQWILQKGISPMTRQPISISSLRSNRLIKDLIETFQNPALANANANTNTNTNTNTQNTNSIVFEKTTKYIKSNFDGKIYIYEVTKPTSIASDTRKPTIYICAIDVSGSMRSDCSNKNGNESDGFSRLDLTKHSLNTIVEMLNEEDELIIIKFSTEASCVFEGKIDSFSKSEAKRVIANLKPENSTNIWGSLQLAYSHAKQAINSNKNIQMLLLTDGESNIDPPRGILHTLDRYLNTDSNANIRNIPITTFGFSCDIDSKLLFDIAEITNGGFSFIPDASMVGTTFINFIANTLATENIQHSIKQVDNWPSDTRIYESNEINPNELYELIRLHTYQTLKSICLVTNSKYRNLPSDVLTSFNKLKIYIKETIEFFERINPNPDDYKMITELYKDFESTNENEAQIYKAISSPEWYRKWGYHYLLSLSLAHKTRKCHNFRDKGVQLYGGTLFEEFRDLANDVFCKIPAPIPTAQNQSDYYRYSNSGYTNSGSVTQPVTRSVPTSMASYVNSSGPCFAPFCQIRLADGSYKKLEDLNGSELLFCDDLTINKIKYISRTRVLDTNSVTNMCKIGKLVVTPWHPIFDDTKSEWVFPNQIVKELPTPIEYLYNIVLENGYYVWINDIKCVSMGHNLTSFDQSNKILEHPYYGTNKVIMDLETFRTGSEKIITLDQYELDRDSNDLICAIRKV